MDHSDYDCLLITILSHGENGFLYSKDTHYKLESLTQYFTADRCPSLAGKPKVTHMHTHSKQLSHSDNECAVFFVLINAHSSFSA